MARPTLLLLTPAAAPADVEDDVDVCVDGSDTDAGSSDLTAVDSLEAAHVPVPECGERYSVDVTALLHEGTSRVFRGTLFVDGSRHSEVVCKIAHGPEGVERIRKEAGLYRGQLAPLQGLYVPTYVGLFEGTMEGCETACLVLSYEGEAMQTSLYTSGIDFRKKVIATLSALHECGVAHNAFNEAAVVLRPSDNAPILVGFGSADPAHTCGCSREHLCFYEPQPHVDAVACEELYWACAAAAVWLPATVEFLNTRVPVRWALEGADALVARAPKGTDPDLARMHAELTREDLLEWIEERELYDGQPLPIKMCD